MTTWVDGRLIPSDALGLKVIDRGFLLGDGIFETLRARHGQVVEWDAHRARLHESASVLSIHLPISDEDLLAGVHRLLAAESLDDAAVRITVSRGSSAMRGLLPSDWQSLRATIVITAWPHEPMSRAMREQGARLGLASLRRDPTSPLAGVKSTSRADHVHARLEATRAGFDDALFLTVDGRLSEATTANVWLVTGDRIRTPGRDAAILAGATRAWLLAVAPGMGVGVAVAEEADLRLEDLPAADEAFLSSSVAGIVPLTAVEGQPIGTGVPGPVTLSLREARERWIDEQTRRA